MRAQPIRSYLIRLCNSLVFVLFPVVSYRTKCRILGLEVGAGEARNPCVIGRISCRLRFCLHRSVADGCWSVASPVIV